MKSSRQRISQILRGLLAVFAVLVFVGAGATLVLTYYWAGEIYDYQDTVDGVHLPGVDAIVCLAGGRGRIAAAGDLWYRYWEHSQVLLGQGAARLSGGVQGPKATDETEQGLTSSITKVPILYFSGMGPQANWNGVSKQFRRGVVPAIRQDHVVIERESSNTEENALWLAQYAQRQHWRRILLLTSSYHMKRARFIFDQVLKGFESPVQVETLSVYQEPFVPEEWRTGPNGIRVTLIEYVKWLYYRSFWSPSGLR